MRIFEHETLKTILERTDLSLETKSQIARLTENFCIEDIKINNLDFVTFAEALVDNLDLDNYLFDQLKELIDIHPTRLTLFNSLLGKLKPDLRLLDFVPIVNKLQHSSNKDTNLKLFDDIKAKLFANTFMAYEKEKIYDYPYLSEMFESPVIKAGRFLSVIYQKLTTIDFKHPAIRKHLFGSFNIEDPLRNKNLLRSFAEELAYIPQGIRFTNLNDINPEDRLIKMVLILKNLIPVEEINLVDFVNDSLSNLHLIVPEIIDTTLEDLTKAISKNLYLSDEQFIDLASRIKAEEARHPNTSLARFKRLIISKFRGSVKDLVTEGKVDINPFYFLEAGKLKLQEGHKMRILVETFRSFLEELAKDESILKDSLLEIDQDGHLKYFQDYSLNEVLFMLYKNPDLLVFQENIAKLIPHIKNPTRKVTNFNGSEGIFDSYQFHPAIRAAVLRSIDQKSLDEYIRKKGSIRARV